jgi:hypothetical protein
VTPEQTLQIYGRAWLERDPEKRISLLADCCADDILFVDLGLGRLKGLSAVSEMIDQYVGMMGGSRAGGDAQKSADSQGELGVRLVTGIEVMHRFFRFSFVWSLPNGDRISGTDFGEFDDDGKLSLIVVFPETLDFPVDGLPTIPSTG